MKKFTKVLESTVSKRYKIECSISLIIEASSEGEAGYLADSILGGIEEHESFVIDNIEESVDNGLMDKDIPKSPFVSGDQVNNFYEGD